MIVAFLALLVPAHADDAKAWRAGNYTFSDELGGFTITGVGGLGTRENPIVVEEELNSSSPVTLVVRTVFPTVDDPAVGNLATSALHIKLLIRNGSGQAWVEFEFELQEILHQPSIFSDGLSFDQRRDDSDIIRSTRFAHFSRDFEPYDRLRFTEGKVDPKERADFSFALTDFTPRWTFYIVQDPRIPSS
ncbi:MULTISPECIES: hypothetical protein [Mesorhizobium]|uniref:Uncharacterized protein n=1 Tax=Mesorhizobium denitrificans TaxID=2294114 RepID=A0A371XIE8_9HYPH|nr:MULTISPECIES: hypothetical protein [Mesorhizobium]RFC68977.1 hypothetical protein DY251_03610 [Mesorhizobium denitrificans]